MVKEILEYFQFLREFFANLFIVCWHHLFTYLCSLMKICFKILSVIFVSLVINIAAAGVATTAAVNKQYEHGSQRDGDTDMSSYETKYGDRENNALGSNSEGERKFDRSENNDSTKSGSALDAVEYDNLWEKITMDKLDLYELYISIRIVYIISGVLLCPYVSCCFNRVLFVLLSIFLVSLNEQMEILGSLFIFIFVSFEYAFVLAG